MENFPNYAGYGQSPTVCVNHPDRVSYAQCGRCNRTVCGECQVALDVGMVCPDCYRDLNGGASSPKRSFIARHWHITYTLILINVVVYGLQLIIPFRWVHNLGMMSGPRVHHGEYYRLITHGFVHSQTDPMHLVWNMIYLFIFGVSLERMMGRWKFLFVYMAATVGAGCSVYLFSYYRGAVGASGGVYGLYGAFFVLLLLRKQKDTARLFMLLMGIDVVQSLFHPNISHAGHFGGLVSGALATFLILPFVKKPEASESSQPPPQQSPKRWFNGRY
ncbi:rhomboid family intramembrane serine protease [Rothia mucilaginosa]|uniref:rhomboid family intramembrane serine protease n=1 Tax=Rothia mucilaginosa TaxID=43675 RepID=UPI0028EE8F24|nr:rhomboid family intramembrane serine protease [Rothia mucilaginosa]